MSQEQLRQLLDIDPLQVAEDLTGKSYKDDKQTEGVGFALAILHNQNKQAALLAHNDSYYGVSLNAYMGILGSLGFGQILDLPFVEAREGRTEHLFAYAQPETGVFISFDTFCGGMNSGKMHYCVKVKEGVDRKKLHRATSSGGWESESEPDWRRKYETGGPKDLYWKGNHDCREAIRFHYNQLKEYFDFINPWPKDPNQDWTDLDLLHYQDWKDFGTGYSAERRDLINETNNNRIMLFPDWARRIINV